MFKSLSKKSKTLIGIGISYLVVKANPDFISDTFTDESKIAKGTEKVEIATTTGQVKLAQCYSPNPSWTKVADTLVRDISNLSYSATINKDIYCDDYNCVLWTDEAAAPGVVCIATNSNVYGNILWSKTDIATTKTWGPNTSIGGENIGGTHAAGLTVGGAIDVGGKNWLERYYSLPAGTFPAMDGCKAKGSGWRSPNILELDSIRDQAKGSSPYSRLPNISGTSYWSSSENDASYAYSMSFNSGSVGEYGTKSVNPYYVRCVRGY